MKKYARLISIAYSSLVMFLVIPVSADAQDVFDNNKHKVVRIEVTGKDFDGYTRTRFGSGFFIHKDGFLLTNLHVVGKPDDWSIETGKINRKIKLFWTDTSGAPREETRVVVVYYDPIVDLALLRIPQSNIPAVRIGDSRTVRVNDRVFAVGYQAGEPQPSAAMGRIQLAFDSLYGGFFRFAAAIQEGNSGGPLLNEDAEVVGIINAGLRYARGQGFAIPINLASSLIAQIMRPPRFDQ